jgi:hypothetical protein
VVIAIGDQFVGVEDVVGHQGGVPIAGPPFVHDLGLALRREVVGLLANDREHVGLPILQRGEGHQEQQQIALRLGGDPAALLIGLFTPRAPFFIEPGPRVDERIHVRLGRVAHGIIAGLFGLAALPRSSPGITLHEHRMRIDQILERQTSVDELFHPVQAMALDVAANPGGVVGHLVHHPPVGARKPIVVLEEIAMAVDVGHHRFLIDRGVVFQQIGVARVVVDDHFVDAPQPVGVLLAQALVLHAETPMRIALGETSISRDLRDLVSRQHLEDGRVEIQLLAARELGDDRGLFVQFIG